MNKDILTKHFKKIPTLQTPRLTLRRIKLSDVEDMYEYSHLASVTEYLTWYEHPDMLYTHRYLELIRKQYSHGEFFDWALVLKDGGKMIGTCGFTSFDLSNNSAEVGYVLNPEYHGCGYATEALRCVLAHGFMALNLHRIQARFIDGNEPSRRVMERCGMRLEGTSPSSMYIKEEYKTIHTYAMLSDEYIKKYL